MLVAGTFSRPRVVPSHSLRTQAPPQLNPPLGAYSAVRTFKS